MGMFKTCVGINDWNGGATHWVDAVVDTRAAYSAMPEAMLRQAGWIPRSQETFTLADGSRRVYQTGDVLFSIGEKDHYSRVVFLPENDRCILGAATLQIFALIPDTTNHRLIPAPEISI